jgi:soluble lytic murein transglycosylase
MSVALLFFLLFLHAVDVQARDRGICIEAAAGAEAGAEFDIVKALEPLDGKHPKLAAAARLRAARKFAEADREYEAAAAAVTDPELKQRIEYLRARLSVDAGKLEEGAQRYLALAGRCELLADWCLYRAATALHETGKLAESIKAAERISPTFPRHTAAMQLQCRAHAKLGDARAVLACVDRLEDPGPAMLLLAARAGLDAGEDARAAGAVREILLKHPASGEAEEADDLVELLADRKVADPVAFTAADKLDRADRLLSAYRYSDCRTEAESVMDSVPRASPEWCRAQAVVAVSLARAREQTKSLPHFERLVAQCPDSLSDSVLYRGTEAARMAGNADFALQWAEKLVALHSGSTLCDDALLFAAQACERNGDADKTRTIARSILDRFPAGDMTPDAAWLLVWGEFQGGKLQAALDLAADFEMRMPARQDYRTNGRLSYWTGRILQLQGKKREARPHFRRTLERYPLSWYGLLAYLRLEEDRKGRGEKVLAQVRQASAPTVPPLSDVLAAAACLRLNLERASALASMGCIDEAQAELRTALQQGGDSTPPRLLLSAWLLDRVGLHSQSHDILRRQVPDFQYAWPVAEDDRWWTVAFPRPFLDVVMTGAADEGVPWNLVFGVMREESGFDPEIESYAHALGLLQLLRKTAAHMAKRDVSRSELFRPSVNVPLGTRYLAWLDKRFGHPVLVVAGYNSGPGGVKRSLARTRNSDVDEFVELIPFDQTRRYTKRVLSSAWAYQVLYGDKAGVIPFPLTLPGKKHKAP